MPDIAGALGRLAMVVVLLGLVIGVFIYQATTGGNINIDATSSSLITTQASELNTTVASVWSAVTSVTGFIVIGVIALIAIGILGKRFLSGGGKL